MQSNFFQRVVVINLDRREDRWREFQAGLPRDWPFVTLERFAAVDGSQCTLPSWWKENAAGWGCVQSHLKVLQQCLADEIESVLILEDDVAFCDDFSGRVQAYLQQLPDDWQMCYLGGQLIGFRHKPQPMNAQVYRPFNVHRTLAYAVRGRETMQMLVAHLQDEHRWQGGHIDHHYGRLHETGNVIVYCPARWLVGQRAGMSDIVQQTTEQQFWVDAKDLYELKQQPLVVVLGLPGSGSDQVALKLQSEGVDFGKIFARGRVLEARHVVEFCQQAIRFPEPKILLSEAELERGFALMVEEMKYKALLKQTTAGLKCFELCRLGESLLKVAGKVQLVHVARPVEACLQTLSPTSAVSQEQLRSFLEWLEDGRCNVLHCGRIFALILAELSS